MATQVKLYYTDRNDTYKEWELLPNKLLIVEDIEAYLAPKSKITLSNIQYQKNQLELGLNLELPESYSQAKTHTSFKYVSIQNAGELVHYYFVKNIVWRAQKTCRLELVMDVLNTFKEGYDYEWKANTKIVREHKSRYTANNFSLYIENFSVEDAAGVLNLYDEVYFGYMDGEGDEQWLSKVIIEKYDTDLRLTFNSSLSGFNSLKAIVAREVGLEHDFILSLDTGYDNYIEINFRDYYFNGALFNKIDYIQENINPLLICKNFKGENIEDVGPLKQTWYLLYRNTNNPDPDDLTNPVECYLIPEKSVDVTSGSITASKVYPENLKEGYWYYCKCYINGVRNIQLTFSNGYTSHNSGPQDHIVMMRRVGDRIEAREFSASLGVAFPYPLQTGLTFITLGSLPCPYIISPYQLNNDELASSNTFSNEQYWTASGAAATTGNVNNIDRTDPKNIKLIKLPYCPYTFNIDENNNYINVEGSQWTYVSLHQANSTDIACLRLDDLNTKLVNSLIGPEEIFNNFASSGDLQNISLGDLRTRLDPKLLNSEFYQPKLVYDSFSFTFELEKLDLSHYINLDERKLVLTFLMTRTINSKFLFKVVDYAIDKAETNYPDVLCIGRNNEEVLYNSSYVAYVRTGFNYDVKAKNMSNAAQWIGVGASGIGMATSLLLPSVPLKVAGVIGSLISMALSVKQAVVSTINNENNLKQKILQEQNRTASVAGSDDVDLMSEYTENRLKYLLYEPTDVMKSMLDDLFFYAGYVSNRMGIPTHNNRVNFDYLECEPAIQAVASIPEDCLGELINCFKTGVTYLHKTNRESNKWDFAQKYENWEVELLEA